MTFMTECDKSTVFYIPIARARRMIGLAYAIFFLIFSIGFTLAVFLGHSKYALMDNIIFLGLLNIILLVPAAIFLRLAYPPRRVLSRLEVCRTGLRYYPGWFERFSGASIGEAEITEQSKEILLCKCVLEFYPDGYKIILRSRDGSEREFKSGDLATTLDVHTSEKIASGITDATGLPVRIVKRTQLANGTIEETPWLNPTMKAKWVGAVTLLVGILPFLGGGIVGYVMPHPIVIVLIGLALWLCQMLVLYSFSKKDQKKLGERLLLSMTTIFTFSASYAVAVVVVANMFRTH